MLSGVFCLLMSLAEKITGEIPRVTMTDSAGNVLISQGVASVEWIIPEHQTPLDSEPHPARQPE